MPRIPRVVIPNGPHRVSQRSHRDEDVFLSDEDYQRFLDLLGAYAQMHDLAVQAYCLLSNRFDLVVVPKRAESLSAALKPTSLRYSQELNRRLGVRGHVWQGRVLSCPLDRRFFWAAVRHVERSPIRARLVRKAHRYRWSSAAGHCGMWEDPLLSGHLERRREVPDWSAWLAEAEDEQVIRELELCTRAGRPAGSKQFVQKLEALTGRVLRRRPPGRPRKEK